MTAEFVSGTIELLSVLPSNMSLGPITVNAYSFSDGVNTLTQTNSSLVQSSVSTNGNGVITDWIVDMVAVPSEISTNNHGFPPGSPSVGDGGCVCSFPPSDAVFGQNSNDAGVWTLVPEPSTGLLSALSLLMFNLANAIKKTRGHGRCLGLVSGRGGSVRP